jgi:hypothetical protein
MMHEQNKFPTNERGEVTRNVNDDLAIWKAELKDFLEETRGELQNLMVEMGTPGERVSHPKVSIKPQKQEPIRSEPIHLEPQPVVNQSEITEPTSPHNEEPDVDDRLEQLKRRIAEKLKTIEPHSPE